MENTIQEITLTTMCGSLVLASLRTKYKEKHDSFQFMSVESLVSFDSFNKKYIKDWIR